MKKTDDLPHHHKLGKEGEMYALGYVLDRGYKVLHTNWRSGNKEIDIITQKEDMLVVFEVKTRFSNYWEEPKDAVRLRKQKNIIEAADAYVEKYDVDLEVQFDIISLTYNGRDFELEHIPDAFYPTL
ncbi:MAG: YraN family protein [Bacteroidales bacterium]